ncbi:hypothetical protein CR205_10490 [Alteribacter lacisalsi]|uniref:Uncharacterized protein n=1 Tax=Alteribacter lacisalsi TaxID=2045244 RepID=A0A2W0HGE8_9BACI|nr:hypothetical protein [Alteribacter lacisalsi]PYZ98970.1 hypothetical protein CR205_10490 [Alteribacter lacisalsi]
MRRLTVFGKSCVIIGAGLLLLGSSLVIMDFAGGELSFTSLTFIPTGLALMIIASNIKKDRVSNSRLEN